MTNSSRVYIDESGDEGFMFLPDEQVAALAGIVRLRN